MDDPAILEMLLEIMRQSNLEIRTAPMGGQGGGLCRLKDKILFYVDSDVSTGEMIAITAGAVGQIADVESMYLRPQIREVIELYRSRNESEKI
jgi:hypothetical protein